MLHKEYHFLFQEYYEVNVLTTTDSHIEVPKDLADCMESVIGAVYLDCGGNLKVTWEVFRSHFADIIGKNVLTDTLINLRLNILVMNT